MKVTIWKSRKKIKGNFNGGRNPNEFVRMVGLALGRFVIDCLKLDEGSGQDTVMKSLEEYCEKVLIPSFLEGAGCREVEE